MLSAVETFGNAAATAHNPFAIAAAVVMPSQNQQTGPVNLDHYTIGHSALLSAHHRHHFNHHQLLSAATNNHHHHHHHSGIYLPPTPSNLTTNVNHLHHHHHQQQQQQQHHHHQQQQQQHNSHQHHHSVTNLQPSPSSSIYSTSSSSSCSSSSPPLLPQLPPPAIPPITQSKSPRLCIDSEIGSMSEVSSTAMSSTEFVRPHPKQPRYSSTSLINSTINNNNINNHNNNNNSNSNSNNNNNNNNNNNCTINNINNNNLTGSNGIPLHVRNNNKLGLINNSGLASASITRTRKYSAEPQSGPVNLVTNNNNNSLNNNNNNNSNCNNNNIDNNSNLHINSNSNNNLISNNNNNNKVDNHNNNCNSKCVSSSVDLDINCKNILGIPLIHNQKSQSTARSLNDSELMSAIYSQKLPYAAAPSSAVTNSIGVGVGATPYQFNYSHIYGATHYGTPLYTNHHNLNNNRCQQIQTSFVGATHPNDLTFSPYIPSSIQYSAAASPGVGGTGGPQHLSTIVQKPTPLSPTSLINNSQNCKTQLQHQRTNIAHQLTQQTQLAHNLIAPDHHLQQQQHQQQQHQHRSVHQQPQQLQQQQQQQHDKTNFSNSKLSSAVTSAGFKVPCGKDGSLKHRFLTRPVSENHEPKKKLTTTNTTPFIRNNLPLLKFNKGAIIELHSGLLRKVEDMRTEDFIQSADKSPNHQLSDSTVVKISINPNSVVITFCYDKNRFRKDVEVSSEHPFFVYGQGWASCSPELSFHIFGLKCQRLQVGDVCISLVERDECDEQITIKNSLVSHYNNSNNNNNNNNKDIDSQSIYPQNLSRKADHLSPTTLTSSAGVTVSSRLAAAGPQSSILQAADTSTSYLPLSHLTYDLNPYDRKSSPLQQQCTSSLLGPPPPPPPPPSSSLSLNLNRNECHYIEPIRNSPPLLHSRDIRNAQQQHQQQQHINFDVSTSGIVNRKHRYILDDNNKMNNNNNDNRGQDFSISTSTIDEPIDVSLSRKRRWSTASDNNNCDDHNDNNDNINDDNCHKQIVTKTLSSC